MTSHGDLAQPPAGQTVWTITDDPGNDAGLAWDWVLIGDGIVAMADPLGVVTNLRLLGEEGEILTAGQSALYINRLVRDLPWQDEVWRALKAA